jgi:hypothetical protein
MPQVCDGLGFGIFSEGICLREPRQGEPGVAFTFDGNDKMRPIQSRNWSAVQTDGTLKGPRYFHQGDYSAFWAKRQSL